MGARVTLVGPPPLIPRGIEAMGCEVSYEIDAIKAADVVYVLRMQRGTDGRGRQLRALAARVHGALGRDARTAPARPEGDASGADEPRRRDRPARRRRGGRADRARRFARGSSFGWRFSTTCSRMGLPASRPQPCTRSEPHDAVRQAGQRRSRHPRCARARRGRGRGRGARRPRRRRHDRPAGDEPRDERAPRRRRREASYSRPHSSIRTSTCARPAERTRRRSLPAPPPQQPAVTARSWRCRIPSRSSTRRPCSARSPRRPRQRRTCRSAFSQRSRETRAARS